ncbi:MAG TPA: hypothetical protein VHW95_03200 [Steroidobacteraceae bacterium]|jgi:hypothetical protein|nr:hypothetical protein [Steroidobacteraceae bacterium]
MKTKISASTHHSQRRFFFAVSGCTAFSVPQWVQKRDFALSSVPQLVQNAFITPSRANFPYD